MRRRVLERDAAGESDENVLAFADGKVWIRVRAWLGYERSKYRGTHALELRLKAGREEFGEGIALAVAYKRIR